MDRRIEGIKVKLLVSACLAGCRCRYDGKSYEDEILRVLVEKGLALSACPEVLGGFAIPRPRAEIVEGTGEDVLLRRARVINEKGEDVTPQFVRGAFKFLDLAIKNNIKYAILKDKSPSCGVYNIYDGSFAGKLKQGRGVSSALLRKWGIIIYSNEQIK